MVLAQKEDDNVTFCAAAPIKPTCCDETPGNQRRVEMQMRRQRWERRVGDQDQKVNQSPAGRHSRGIKLATLFKPLSSSLVAVFISFWNLFMYKN